MNRRFFLYTLVATVSTFSVGCGDRNKDDVGRQRDGPLVVVAVNGPLQYFAQRIGGVEVESNCPCPPESIPSLWAPDTDALDKFYSADLILLNGGGYAKWTITTSLPDSKLVNTGRTFKVDWLTMSEAVRHQHGPDGEHSHEATIGEFWLDPTLAIQQASRIEEALAKRAPEHKDEFAARFDELKKDLQDLRTSFENAISKDTQLLAAEPAFEYVAQSAGHPLTRLTWANLNEPSEDELAEFLAKLVADKPKLFLLSAPPSGNLSKQLEAAGIRVVVFDMCETTTDRSYPARMQENVERLNLADALESE